MNSRMNYGVVTQIAQRSLVLVGLLAGTLLVGGFAQAQSNGAAAPEKNARAEEAKTNRAASASAATPKVTAAVPGKSSPSGPQEGIQVHGHWTIDIRKPDGTVVSHTDFENKLAGQGANFLTGLLAGQLSSGGWGITLGSPSAANEPCADASGNPASCVIESSLLVLGYDCPNGNTYCFTTLSITPNTPPTNPATGLTGPAVLTLQGTAVAGNNLGSIGYVNTFISLCTGSTSPSACASQFPPLVMGSQFTFKPLDGLAGDPNPIPVTSGQTIAVTVQISFQ